MLWHVLVLHCSLHWTTIFAKKLSENSAIFINLAFWEKVKPVKCVAIFLRVVNALPHFCDFPLWSLSVSEWHCVPSRYYVHTETISYAVQWVLTGMPALSLSWWCILLSVHSRCPDLVLEVPHFVLRSTGAAWWHLRAAASVVRCRLRAKQPCGAVEFDAVVASGKPGAVIIKATI